MIEWGLLIAWIGFRLLSPWIYLWLASRLAAKAGLPRGWALTQALPIPLLGTIAIWAFAFARWPTERDS